jgi:hypothetical protein
MKQPIDWAGTTRALDFLEYELKNERFPRHLSYLIRHVQEHVRITHDTGGLQGNDTICPHLNEPML